MSTKDDQEVLRRLVQHVSRAFYEPKYTIIMDQLSRHPVIKDDDLASRMGLQPKELNKNIAVLSNDSLVKIYRQNELKEGAQRAVGRQYYYIDYEHFCNVVKWRISKMFKKIDNNLRNEMQNKGYICPQCKTTYAALDVDKLMNFSLGILSCEICQAEVVDNDNTESAQGNDDRMQRFNYQMRFIRAGLQKSEGMVLPAFDVAGWVKTHSVDPEKQKAAVAGAGLKIAGSDPNKQEDKGIGVVISSEKDEATRKAERDAEAEMKRQQNALPAWHLKSTISGDLTALGIAESERAEAAAMNNALPKTNEDILKGLGVVGPRQDQSKPIIQVEEDIKPIISRNESDFYDSYYSSLAASAQATPAASAPGSSENGNENIDDEEEDRKPNVQYLDSLNAYRKRSRSRDDEGPSQRSKIVKTEPVDALPPAAVAAIPPAEESMEQDDPMVQVNGVAKKYSEVTDDDHDLMTPDEYTAFYEIMTSRS